MTLISSASAKEHYAWRLYADLALGLIQAERDLCHNEPVPFGLAATVHRKDFWTCRFVSHTFPWAQFRRRKETVKAYTPRKLRGSIRGSVQVTEGHIQDFNLLDRLRRFSTAVTYYDEQVRLKTK